MFLFAQTVWQYFATNFSQIPIKRTKRVLEMMRNHAVNSRLEEVEQRKPDFRSLVIAVMESLIVSQSVVIEEDSRRDVERDEHVD